MSFRIYLTGALIWSLSLTAGPAAGQSSSKDSGGDHKFSAAVSWGHFAYDPGFAMEITTPSFMRNHFSLRFRASLQGLEEYKATYRDWAFYQSYALGLVYSTRIVDHAKFFIEAGTFGIVPDKSFSSKNLVHGYYQLSGVEVFFLNRSRTAMSFYLGLGPAFINAYAERIENAPRYGNGIVYLNGVRLYFN